MKTNLARVLLLLVVAAGVQCRKKAAEIPPAEPVAAAESTSTERRPPTPVPTAVPDCTDDHLIVIDPNAPTNSPTPRCASKSANNGSGDRIVWQAAGKMIKVQWVIMSPTTAPYPYTLNCVGTSDTCGSGLMAKDAAEGSDAQYKVTVVGSANPPTLGHIIIKH